MKNCAKSLLKIGSVTIAAASALTACESASPPGAPAPGAPVVGEPVDPAKDIVNVAARQELTLGMVMEIHITPNTLELLHIGMIQVRRDPRGDDVTPERGDGSSAHWVVVEALDSRGELISRTAVSDPRNVVEEEVGGHEILDRTVFASLPTSRRVQTLRITSTALDEALSLEVARVMAEFCDAHPSLDECKAR